MSDEMPPGMTMGNLPYGATNISGVRNLPEVEGMSLRDWFAGQCVPEAMRQFVMNEPNDFTECAEIAYKMADALIAQREKKQ